MKNIAYFKGVVYPDKSFTIGYVAKKQVSLAEKEHDRDFEEQHDSYEYTTKEYGRTVKKEHKFFSEPVTPDRFIKRDESSRKAETYGKRGITLFGKRNLRNIPLLLQKKFGIKRLGFYTATLPVLSEDALELALDRWGEIVRRFFQKLKRLYKKRGREFWYISCTEIQESRYESYGMPYPHLHWVAESRPKRFGNFTLLANDIRIAWMQTVKEVLHPCKDGFPETEQAYQACIDAQVVKKSAAAYLGKYVSKGVKVVNKMIEDGYEYLPRQWWSASMNCKKLFKKSLIHLCPETSHSIFYGLDDYLESGLLTYGDRNYVVFKSSGNEVCIGCHGRMSAKFVNILAEKTDGVFELGK